MARKTYADARRPVEPIVESKDNSPAGGTIARHPAFAQIGASRVQGSANLYGSDFGHHNYVIVRISESVLHRTLSRDWPSGGNRIVEVAMSEAQWATFISALNQGDGVQCTLEYRELTGLVPSFPNPVNRVDQFSDEMKETLADALKRMKDAAQEADRTRAPKALKDSIAMAIQEIEKNIPFVAEQFGGHMEGVVEKAKIEIHSWMEGTIRRAGLEALGAEAPIQIKDQSKKGQD